MKYKRHIFLECTLDAARWDRQMDGHRTDALPLSASRATNPPLSVGDQPPTSDTVKHTLLFTQLSDDSSATN